MGCVYSLHLIEPKRYEKIHALFAVDGFPNMDLKQIKKLFSELEKKTDRFLESSFEGLDEEGDESKQHFWNDLFSQLISSKTIYLDKAPGLGLSDALKIIPDLKPLAGLSFQTRGFPYKFPLPKSIDCEPFYGLWDSSDFKPLIPTIEKFSSKKSVDEFIAGYKPGFFEKAFGKDKKNLDALNKWINDDYLWRHWTLVVGALKEAVKKGYYIGHSMSC